MYIRNFGSTFFLIAFFFCSELTTVEKCVRGAKPYGFFADFLWAINHLEYCLATNKTPVIYWGSEFSYYSPQGYNGATNCWEYYFEPVSDLSYKPGDPLHKEDFYKRDTNFSTLWWYVQYLDNAYKLTKTEQESLKPIEDHDKRYASEEFNGQRNLAYPVGAFHLYSQQFRRMVKEEIIDRFIKIKPSVEQKVTAFFDATMLHKKTIGIHLRGPHIWNEVLFVPFDYIFQEANKYAAEGYQFFIATDQKPLLELAKKQLNGTVIYYECERFDKTTSPVGHGPKLHPKLGEDILIEMLLLSLCDHLIHTVSNVSTTALYFNPELPHTLLY
jgi:hypothetical protein